VGTISLPSSTTGKRELIEILFYRGRRILENKTKENSPITQGVQYAA
jgi:hypothetical protein